MAAVENRKKLVIMNFSGVYEKEDFYSMQSLSRERAGFKSFSGTAGFKARGKKACGCPSRPPDNRIFHRKKFLRVVRNRKTGHNPCFCEKKILLRGTAGKRQGSVPVIKSQPIREREMQDLYSEICRVRKSFARQVTAKLIWL